MTTEVEGDLVKEKAGGVDLDFLLSRLERLHQAGAIAPGEYTSSKSELLARLASKSRAEREL